MFPRDISDWLKSSPLAGSWEWLTESYDKTAETLTSLGISTGSELGHLYLHYGPASVRGWYELAEADGIAEHTALAHEALEVPQSYLALSGIEGQGIILYQPATGAVFDVEFGQFERLADGTLEPIAPSVVEYLRWCMARDASR